MTVTMTYEIVPVEFVRSYENEYEPDGSDCDWNYCGPILQAIGATANDWVTVFQLSGDGTNAELIIGIFGQSELYYKVSCPMTSKTFEFLCSEFISSNCVTPDTIDRINGYRERLGLVPWTLETAYRDYFGDILYP
jgi:hypothetical protein